LNVRRTIAEAKELINQYMENKGIRKALAAQLTNAERHFDKMEELKNQGREEEALKEEKRYRNSIKKVIKQLDQHSGKHINDEHAGEIIAVLTDLQ
jgi:parvulin-like peptidyl-prolyl isomerase